MFKKNGIKIAGYNMIEIMLVLFAGSMVTMFSILGYNMYDKAVKMRAEVKNVKMLQEVIKNNYIHSKSYKDLNNDKVAHGRGLPDSYAFRTFWGGGVDLSFKTVNKADDTYIIALKDTPAKFCGELVGATSGGFTEIKVNADIIAKTANNFDIGAIATACGKKDLNQVELIYTRLPDPCMQPKVNWGAFPVEHNCTAPNFGMFDGDIKTYTADTPMLGSATLKCIDGEFVPQGPTPSCSAPPCPSKQISWKVNTNMFNPVTGTPENLNIECSGPIATKNSQYSAYLSSSVVANTTNTGNATFNCEFGSWVEKAGSTCAGFCKAKYGVTWIDPANPTETCTGNIPKTGYQNTADFKPSDSNYSGDAHATCNPFTGDFIAVSGTCSKNCNNLPITWSQNVGTATYTCNGVATAEHGKSSLISIERPDLRGSVTATCNNGVWTGLAGAKCGTVVTVDQSSVGRGDCVTVNCPVVDGNPSYVIGGVISFGGGDSRGCVSVATNSTTAFLKEGDVCGRGIGSWTVKCSTAKLDAPINETNFPMYRKPVHIYPGTSSAAGCP